MRPENSTVNVREPRTIFQSSACAANVLAQRLADLSLDRTATSLRQIPHRLGQRHRNASRENGGRLDHHATPLIAASVTAFHSAARSTVHGARQSPPVRRAGQPILTHSPQSLVSKNGESICKVWLALKPPFCWMSAVLALPSFAQ